MIVMRMTFPRSLSLSLALGTAFAASPGALPLLPAPAARAQAAPAATASAITAPVSALYAALSRIQAPNSGSFAQRTQILGPVVDKVYDLETVLRASVGLRYASFSDADKQRLRDVFRQFTVARYVSSFKPGGDARFTIDPTPRPAPVGTDQIVTTHIGSTDDTDGTEIDYVLRSSPQGWRIVEVLLKGSISQVAAQRSDFSGALASGNVQNLIALLQKKVQAFSED